MFGLTPTKILFTVLIIAIVWYGFKMLGRIEERRANRPVDQQASPKPARRKSRRAENQAENQAEDMVACPKCGTFVRSGGATSCGREDCPYPG